MYCLWNGEYGDHDLSFVPSLETTLKIQDEQYKHYIGCEVGDFTCLKVEYGGWKTEEAIKCGLTPPKHRSFDQNVHIRIVAS